MKASGINSDAIFISVNGVDVTAGAIIERIDREEIGAAKQWHLRYRPPVSLPPGPHHVQIDASDTAGNSSRRQWSFYLQVPKPKVSWDASLTNVLDYHYLPLEHSTTRPISPPICNYQDSCSPFNCKLALLIIPGSGLNPIFTIIISTWISTLLVGRPNGLRCNMVISIYRLNPAYYYLAWVSRVVRLVMVYPIRLGSGVFLRGRP